MELDALRRFYSVRKSRRPQLRATLHRQVVTALRSRGHEIDDCDLYAESFNPVMGEQVRMQYHDVEFNRAPIAPMPIACWRRKR
jgi:putative NADPH-quinone reductase